MGSTSTWFSARPSKPCQRSPGFNTHSDFVSLGRSAMASGCQTSNHQEPSTCFLTAAIARRKLSASSMVSCTRARPAGCSIIAAATSHDAMMPYCGEVEVCIMKASLKRAMSSRLFSPCCTWIIDACDHAASSLCVEWVAKVIALAARAGLDDEMP